MPGYELIGYKEKKALTKLIDDGGILFAHGFDKIRKNYHYHTKHPTYELAL